MKKNILITVIVTASFLFFNFSQKKYNQKEFVLVELVSKQIPGFTKKVKVAEINKSDIDKLSQPLKALAAYYSALAGTNCDGNNCELTSALGLGSQGSDEHKKIIEKWFPHDSVAQGLLAQNCIQSSNGSSNFTNYNSLIFKVKGDTVFTSFIILKYYHGESTLQNGNDKAVIDSNQIIIMHNTK